MAHEKVQTSPKDDYLKLTTSAIPMSGSRLDDAMKTLHGDNWKAKMQGAGGAAPAAAQKAGDAGIARPTTQDDFAKLKSGDVYIDPDDGKKYRKK